MRMRSKSKSSLETVRNWNDRHMQNISLASHSHHFKPNNGFKSRTWSPFFGCRNISIIKKSIESTVCSLLSFKHNKIKKGFVFCMLFKVIHCHLYIQIKNSVNWSELKQCIFVNRELEIRMSNGNTYGKGNMLSGYWQLCEMYDVWVNQMSDKRSRTSAEYNF